MNVKGLHHVAYRCKDAQETVKFYSELLDMPFRLALAENRVPSTKEWSPHIHIFFEMDDGSYLAFFELPEAPAMQRDPATPDWVQHLALKVPSVQVLDDYKRRLEAAGIKVVGPTDHGFCRSIYFFDPNGHRMELSVDTSTPDLMKRLLAEATPVLKHWNEHKTALADLDWIHANERERM
jgi:catechol 2,3-dioxygenase-like lactoylglutathione lyase family enzyme